MTLHRVAAFQAHSFKLGIRHGFNASLKSGQRVDRYAQRVPVATTSLDIAVGSRSIVDDRPASGTSFVNWT